MSLKDFYVSIGGNYDDAMGRMTDENFILKYVLKFSGFEELNGIKAALNSEDWSEAFRNCHSLKGMAGNLGFERLYNTSSELCEILRPCVKPACDIRPLVDKTEALLTEIKENKKITEQ